MTTSSISTNAMSPAVTAAQDQERNLKSATAYATMTIGKIGLWSAVLTSICAIAYGISVIVFMASALSNPSPSAAQGWTGIDAFLANFQPIQMLPVIPSLLLIPAFTALMVCIDSFAPEERRIWSRLGLAFTFIYASMAAINYMTQLLPVWRSINNGETDGLAMFVLGNPHSMFWALAYAYIFMHLAMLFAAPVFTGNPLEKRIRTLFILNGVSGLITLVNVFFDSPPLYLLGSLIFWCPVFTAATVSVAVLFNRTARKQ